MSEPSPIPNDGDVTKTRRLVPQFSLTKQDLGSDNARSSRPSCDTPKKPVIRFTREQLISLRKESRILPSMASMADIMSHETLSPVCFSRLEPEDVIRIYNSANRDTHGRGRARGLKPNRDELSEKNEKADMWDDDAPAAQDTLDLAGFAEAALKFRSDTKELKSLGPNESDLINEDVVSSIFDTAQATTSVEEQPSLSTGMLDQKAGSIVADFSGAAVSGATLSGNLEPAVQSLFPQLNFGISSSFDIFGTKAASLEPVEWFYRDPHNQVQGPFSQETMKVWNDDGYFTLDLPIKIGRWQQFHLFKVVYPNAASAFIEVPPEPLQISFPFGTPSSAVPQQMKPNELIPPILAVDFIDQVRSKDSTITNSIGQSSHVDTKNAQQVTDSSVQHNTEKSDFAKKLLGIGKKKVDSSFEAAVDAQPSMPESHLVRNNDAEFNTSLDNSVAKPSKGWNSQTTNKSVVSLADIQQQQQQEIKKGGNVVATTAQVSSSSAPPTSAMSFQLKSLLGVRNGAEKEDKNKAAWSSPVVAAVDPSASSLKEIMNEELNKKQTTEVDVVPTNKPLSLSWAAKAKSNAVNTNTVAKVEPLQTSIPTSKGALDKVNLTPANGLKSTDNRKAVDKSEFGGKTMSKDMAEWCSTQLKKLKGTDEAMELLQFCMSLKSSVEVREYLSQYLGSSPQVTNFATEFIKFKDGGNRPQTIEKQHDNNNKFQNVTVLKKKKPQGTK